MNIPFQSDGQSTLSLTIRECPIPSEATHPPAYIAAIARNLLARHLREKQKELRAFRRLLDTIGKGDSLEHPGDAGARTEREDILNDIATNLPAASMALLRMRFFEDLSPREMAARLGCSEQAVHKRLQRLLQRLRRRYGVDE
jgi:RNA polymerase sigma factor (sigma-70 family)